MKAAIIILLIIVGASCTPPKESTSAVKVALIDSNKALQFTGLERQVINEIARDSTATAWQSLIPVYRMPADTDLKSYQPVQPGNYRMQHSTIVFTPDTPFVKGKMYFVRSYQPMAGTTLTDFMKGRSRAGTLKYIDLIFKP